MRNITKEYLNKLDEKKFDSYCGGEGLGSVFDVVDVEEAKQILQDFEIALLNSYDQEKQATYKSPTTEPKY